MSQMRHISIKSQINCQNFSYCYKLFIAFWNFYLLCFAKNLGHNDTCVLVEEQTQNITKFNFNSDAA